MTKRILSLILVLLLCLSFMPPVAMADSSTFEDGVYFTKTLLPATETQPSKIKLEAYTTGSSTTTTTTVPADIILVLDQSGSMDDTITGGTKLEVMKSAVQSFVRQVRALDGDHRIAVVGFASESGYSDNTEILTAVKSMTITNVEYVVVTGPLNTRNAYYIRSGDEYRQISYDDGQWQTGGRRPQRVDVASTTVYERQVV